MPIYLTLFLLSSYSLIKRMSDPSQAVNFSDRLAMGYAETQDCGLVLNGAWTPIVSCLNNFLGLVFQLPVTYLLVTLALKFLIYCCVFQILRHSLPKVYSNTFSSLVALYTLLFLTVLGGGRFFIAGGELILMSSIYTGVWAQLLILLGVLYFLKNRFLLAGGILSVAIFIHPANTFHVAVILGIAILFFTKSPHRLSHSIVYGGPLALALIAQYFAAYGIPIQLEQLLSHDSTKSLNVLLEDSVQSPLVGLSSADWYDYIFLQDADDLSLIWNLSTPSGIGYLLFFSIATYCAFRVERPVSLVDLVSRPPLNIIIASLTYFCICFLIEYTRMPQLIFESQIVTQPRRALYFPVIFLSFYVVRYSIDFFSTDNSVSIRKASEVLGLGTIFCFILYFTNKSANISPLVIFLLWVLILSATVGRTALVPGVMENPLSIVCKRQTLYSFAALGILVVKTLPFLTPTTFSNVTKTFLSVTPRTFQDYVEFQNRSLGKHASPFQAELLSWVQTNTNGDAAFVSVGLPEQFDMDFFQLTGRKLTSLNAYRYRGSMHFSQERFFADMKGLTTMLNVSPDIFFTSAAEIDSRLLVLLKEFSANDFRYLKRWGQTDSYFDYFLTTFDLTVDLPAAYKNNGVTVYKLIRD